MSRRESKRLSCASSTFSRSPPKGARSAPAPVKFVCTTTAMSMKPRSPVATPASEHSNTAQVAPRSRMDPRSFCTCNPEGVLGMAVSYRPTDGRSQDVMGIMYGIITEHQFTNTGGENMHPKNISKYCFQQVGISSLLWIIQLVCHQHNTMSKHMAREVYGGGTSPGWYDVIRKGALLSCVSAGSSSGGCHRSPSMSSNSPDRE